MTDDPGLISAVVIFLNAEPDVLAIDLQVRFDDPLVSIVPLALEEEGMGP